MTAMTVEKVDPTPLAPLGRWISARLVPLCPAWATPNQITVIGAVAALGAGASFVLAGFTRGWLWAAVACILVVWQADTLDGDLARARGLCSGRGAFLDVIADALAFTAIFFGIGASPLALFPLAASAAVLYLCHEILAHSWIVHRGIHLIPEFGPTEARFTVIVFAVAAFFWPGPLLALAGHPLGVFDVMFIAGGLWSGKELVASTVVLYRQLPPAATRRLP